jgi:O-antigen/teichoic acid export membrane protein
LRARLARQDIVVALALLILPLLLFGSVTLGNRTLLPADNLFAGPPWSAFADQLGVGRPHNALLSDLVLENYVWKRFIVQSIQDRSLPLWDPYLFAGHPFLANGQHSAFYPFSLLFYVMPLTSAYGWFTVLQFWLAGLFTYIFLRVLRAGRLGGLIGGITYQLSGFFVVSVVFTMIIAAAIWLPLLLALIEIVIRKQEEKGPVSYSPIPYIFAGAVVLGIQVLAGHIEITYYTLLVGGFYALCRLIVLRRRQRVWRPALRLGAWLLAMALLGLSLGAVQFVPFYEVGSLNFRAGSVTYADVVGWALPVRRAISFLIPDFFGNPSQHTMFDVVTRSWLPVGLNAHGQINPLCPYCTGWDVKTSVEAGAYVGILPLLLAAMAIVGWAADAADGKAPSGNRMGSAVWIFALLAALSLLFAFGTPLYALLYYGLPFWNQLHSPFRWIYPFTLSIAVLAGLGATYLERRVSPTLPPRAMRDHVTPSPSPLKGEGRVPPTPSQGEGVGVRVGSLYTLSLRAGWLAFWGGLAGIAVLLLVLAWPAPFIRLAQMVVDRSGLAQNAFADGRQFLGYQWPNFFKFFLAMLAGGAVLRISRCPIYLPRRLGGLAAWKPLAVAVVALDLLAAGYGFNPAADPGLLDFRPPVVDWLLARQAEAPHFRITTFDAPGQPRTFIDNAPAYWNLEDVRGYDSIIPAQYLHYMNLIQQQGDYLYNRIAPIYAPGYEALNSALLDLLGVRYVLTTQTIPNQGYRLVYDGELRVYENLDALPRAFAVPCAEVVPPEQMDYALRSLNPRQRVIVEAGEGLEIRDWRLEGKKIEDCQWQPATLVTYTPNEVTLRVALDQPGWLVLADSYFPGWKAYEQISNIKSQISNDKSQASNDQSLISNLQSPASNPETELPIYRADGNFRAVYLEPGEWTVRFKYTPMSFKLGAYGSFLAGVMALLLLGWWGWGKVYRESAGDAAVKRIAKNSLVPMGMALMNRLVDFAFAMLMLRILTPEGAGRYQFAVVFIGYVEIFTRFGLGTLLTRQVARDHAQGNRFLSNVTTLRLLLWLASLPLTGIVLWLYVLFGGLAMETVIAVGLFAVGLFFSNISDGLTALFYAYEKAEYPAAISTVTAVTRVSLGALALLLGSGVIGLAGVSVVANVTSVVVLGVLLLRKVFRPSLDNDAGSWRAMLDDSFPLMINHLLMTLFFRIDILILQPTWGDRAVGFYGAAYKYIDGINIIPSYFTLAIFPMMSRYAQTARDSLIRAYILSLRLLLMLALPLAVGTPFIARELILILGGSQYLPDSMIALQLLIWFLPFSFINQVTHYVLIAIDQQRFLTKAFIIGVTFNVVANLILIPRYGYQAAAVTTVFSEWALLIPFYYSIRKNLCHVPWLSIAWRPTLAAAVMGGVLWLLQGANALILVAVAGVVYGSVLALVGGFSQPDMAMVWQLIPLDRLRAKLPGRLGLSGR